MRLGVATARRGWVRKADVLNTLPLDGLLAALSVKSHAQSGSQRTAHENPDTA